MYTVSLDSGTSKQIAALWAEVERTLGYANDPLIILIAIEEDPCCDCSEIADSYLLGELK
jgi:hypothetical protein